MPRENQGTPPAVLPGNEIRLCEANGVAAIISPQRRSRPDGFRDASACPNPFAEGNEHLTLPETGAIRAEGSLPDTPGWTARVVGNKYPLLSDVDDPKGHGFHEVLVECTDARCDLADLSEEHVAAVLRLLRDRLRAMEAMPGVKCVVAYRNSGRGAGASLPHPHMQMLAMPMVPTMLADLSRRRAGWLSARGETWFESAARGEGAIPIEATSRFVAAAVGTPRVPYEMILFPREARARFSEEDDERLAEFAALLSRSLKRMRAVLETPPYNIVFESAPCGIPDIAGWHWNVAILPRRGHFGGFEWATGMWVSSITPEEAAVELRNASV